MFSRIIIISIIYNLNGYMSLTKLLFLVLLIQNKCPNVQSHFVWCSRKVKDVQKDLLNQLTLKTEYKKVDWNFGFPYINATWKVAEKVFP